jgi:hypothetical protein
MDSADKKANGHHKHRLKMAVAPDKFRHLLTPLDLGFTTLKVNAHCSVVSQKRRAVSLHIFKNKSLFIYIFVLFRQRTA